PRLPRRRRVPKRKEKPSSNQRQPKSRRHRRRAPIEAPGVGNTHGQRSKPRKEDRFPMTSLPIPSLPFPLSESLRQQARDELGNRIAADAFRTGEFILTSGKKSDYYIDGKQVTLSPSAALAALLILDIIQDDGAVAVGGMSIGADPIAGAVTALSYLTPRPVNGFMVRKEA